MRSRLTLSLVLLAGLVLMRESRIEPLVSVENGFASWLSTNARRQPPGAPLVLLEITDDDLRAAPWPWSPFDYSLAVNAAMAFGPSVLAVEPLLSWEEGEQVKKAEADQISLLHHQLLRVPKLLLGAELGVAETPPPAPEELPVLTRVSGHLGNLPEFNAITRQPAEQLRLAGAVGFENLPEGPLRRAPLVFRHCGRVVPSFVLQAAMLWYGVAPDEVTVVPGSYIALGNSLRIPIDAHGTFAVDFGVPITRLTVSDLLLSAERAGAEPGEPVAGLAPRLKGSLALLARTDAASRTLEFAGRHGSRGEFFARALATLQQQALARRLPVYAEAAIIAAGLALAWFGARKTKLGAAALVAACVSVYLLAALGVFSTTTVALPLVLPLGLATFVLLLRWLD